MDAYYKRFFDVGSTAGAGIEVYHRRNISAIFALYQVKALLDVLHHLACVGDYYMNGVENRSNSSQVLSAADD